MGLVKTRGSWHKQALSVLFTWLQQLVLWEVKPNAFRLVFFSGKSKILQLSSQSKSLKLRPSRVFGHPLQRRSARLRRRRRPPRRRRGRGRRLRVPGGGCWGRGSGALPSSWGSFKNRVSEPRTAKTKTKNELLAVDRAQWRHPNTACFARIRKQLGPNVGDREKWWVPLKGISLVTHRKSPGAFSSALRNLKSVPTCRFGQLGIFQKW